MKKIPGKQVLVKVEDCIGTYITTAKWVPRYSEEDETFEYDGSEYNEKDDKYYWPEGWYEYQNTNLDFTWSFINDKVIAWTEIKCLNNE